jgi:hypothetical protein
VRAFLPLPDRIQRIPCFRGSARKLISVSTTRFLLTAVAADSPVCPTHHRFFTAEHQKINQKNEHCSNKMILFSGPQGVKLQAGRIAIHEILLPDKQN